MPDPFIYNRPNVPNNLLTPMGQEYWGTPGQQTPPQASTTPQPQMQPQSQYSSHSSEEYPSQPAGDMYGGDQQSKDYHDLLYAIGQMQPVIQKQQDLVNQKNLIFTHMYDRPLTEDEKNALTPSVKLAMESGDRNQLDMEARIINDQIQNRVKGLDTAVSYIFQGYQNDQDRALQSKTQAMDMLKSALSAGYNMDSLSQIYGPTIANQISQTLGGEMVAVPENTGIMQNLRDSAGTDNFADPNVYKQERDNFIKKNPGFTYQQFDSTYSKVLSPNEQRNLGISSDSSSASGLTASGNPSIDSQSPGYATAVVPGSGGLTQSAIDQGAQYMMATGGSLPPGLGLSSTGTGGQRKTAIMNRFGQLSQGQNVSLNKYLLPQQAKAYGQQVSYSANVQRSLGAADSMLSQLIQQFKDKGINTNDATIVNKTVNEVTKQVFDSGEVRAFQAGLQEVSNEYMQVFSRGGSQGVTESVRSRANDIFDGNITIGDLQNIASELQSQGQIAVQQAQQADQNIVSQMGNLGGGFQSNQSSDNNPDPLGILGK